jgi:2-dehydro-3-deoxyphosphogluconate aldolase/(4S)-4-hydroxy-2-oxoglutarate aldolase
MEILEQLAVRKIIPVLTINSLTEIEAICEKLKKMDLNVVEIVLRTEISFEAARLLAKDSDLTVGIGTVTNENDLLKAQNNGIKFAVSPGTDVGLIRCARSIGIPYIPGIATASEIMVCLSEEIKVMKFFPAEAMGGLATLEALSAPFPEVRFIPTGGLSEKNFQSYLAHPSVLAVGGKWMMKQ